MHLLAFYECESGLVLDHFCVGSKKNEQSACIAILHPFLVKGRIISGDAIFSCREWCAAVHAYDGYDVIPIKENNPAVRRHPSEFFADEGIDRSEFGSHKEVNKGHGRLEVREMWTSTQMNEWFEEEWSGMAQVFLMRRQIRKKGEERIEMVYGMTSVPRKKANAKRLLELNRKHWFIEIVQSQMTKTNLLRARGGGDHVADLHLVVCDDDAINQQFNNCRFCSNVASARPCTTRWQNASMDWTMADTSSWR